MSQMSFSDFEYAGKRKQTRRERFLAEMDQVEKTVVVTAGDWDGQVIWSQKEEFFLTSSFEPAMPGLILDELSRRTINEYGRRIHAHENGVAYESRA